MVIVPSLPPKYSSNIQTTLEVYGESKSKRWVGGEREGGSESVLPKRKKRGTERERERERGGDERKRERELNEREEQREGERPWPSGGGGGGGGGTELDARVTEREGWEGGEGGVGGWETKRERVRLRTGGQY